jgi:hypothetical protein
MNRRAFLLGTAETAMTLAGCNQGSGSASKTPTETPPEASGSMSQPPLVSEPDVVVGCDDQIYTGSRFTPDTNDIVGGPLAFVGIRNYAPTWEFASTPDGIKVPISLERGTIVTLVVPETERNHVALAYGPIGLHSVSVADAYRSVRFEACDGQRTEWSGGFIVTDPRCVTLDVWVDHENHPRTIALPFGVERCPELPFSTVR